jgi:hypothetical protein
MFKNVQKCSKMFNNGVVNYKNYIICGDLNSKSVDIGCKETNNNGKILLEFW